MNPSNKTASHIRFVFFLMGIALVFAWSANAHADEMTQISVQNGVTMVRGATVISVSGYVITARTSWGSASIDWTIQTTGSTRFSPNLGSADSIKAIKPGDVIGFSGEVDTSKSTLTVDARFLQDASIVENNTVVNGDVRTIYPDQNIFVVDTGDGTTTVSIDTGAIVTRGGNAADLSDVSKGDVVRAWGTLNAMTRVLSANRVTFSAPSVTQAPGGGFFSTIMAWFEGSRGALSVRDR